MGESVGLFPRRPDLAPVLSDNARTVLERRYLIKDAEGHAIETPDELFWRVAKCVAAVESEPAVWAERFYRLMAALDFVPNSPCLMNAGRRLGQLFACFVLPVSDSIVSPDDEGIFDTIRSSAIIHQSGGGTGFDFSRLRPEGALVASTHGRSSGPVSFMRVFNAATNAIHQGGFRRGANMGILRVDHPDILDFIRLKSDLGEMTNFNLSVAVTDAFLQAVRQDRPHLVVEPHTGRSFPLRAKVRDAEGNLTGTDDHEWSAREVFDLIVRRAWETGEPGLVFIDRVNRFNPTPQIGRMEATNPCVPADTWVMTADGPRQVRDLLKRPAVLLVDGEPFPSETGFFETGRKALREVRTREGYRFRATPDHLVRRIARMTRGVRDTEWAAVRDLVPGDRIALHDHGEVSGWPGSGTGEEGYLLGLLIGDGTLKEDAAVLSVWGEGEGPDGVRSATERAARSLPARSDFSGFQTPIPERTETRLKLVALRDLASRYGLTPAAKRVTPQIERTSSTFHAALLRGLFDSDGSVQGSQEKGVSVRLTQIDIGNLEAVQRMLLRFGIASTIYRDRKTAGSTLLPDGHGGKRLYPTQPVHELVVSGENLLRFREVVAFEHLDKRLKLEGALSAYRRELNRERFTATVESVEAAGEEIVYDVRVPGANAFDGNGLHLHNCGEQPLLPFEACNLGSINLSHFVGPDRRIQWERLAEAIALGVRFLDDVIDANVYPKPQIERIVKGNRKVGLGLMGWADVLFRLEIRYDSEDALALARTLMKFVKEEAWKASMELAAERGAFPNFEGSLFTTEKDHPYFADVWRAETQRLGRPAPMRNATVTTIAPTGTISIIAGASGGIEPLFSLAFYRNVLNGAKLLDVNSFFEETARREGFDRPELIERIVREGSCQKIEEIPQKWRGVFVCAHDIAPEWHMRMQAPFQEFCDNAVSKTVNFPEHATPDEVRRVYELAMELGVKGVTVYRDGSRKNQPMALEKATATPRRPVPDEAEGKRYRYRTNLGSAFITITEDERGPREVFTSIGKCGSDISALSEAICRILSTALGYGVPMKELAEQLLNITSQPIPSDGGWVKSLPDAIGQAMMRHLQAKSDQAGKATGSLCPECGAALRFEEGCSGGKCACGFARC